jgi:hypothetical protein
VKICQFEQEALFQFVKGTSRLRAPSTKSTTANFSRAKKCPQVPENIGGCGRDRTGDPLLAKRKPRIHILKPMPLILNSLFFNAVFSSC